MLRNKDVDRLKVLDKLINLENDTIDDLIEQAVTVARMIEPKLEDIASYGPIERMVMQVQEMQRDVKELKDAVRVLNMRLATTGTTPTWPSNPGFTGPTMGSGSYTPGYGATPPITGTTSHPGTWALDITTAGTTAGMSISPLTATQVKGLQDDHEAWGPMGLKDWMLESEQVKKYAETISQSTKNDPKI
jgi:hypothetical protein